MEAGSPLYEQCAVCKRKELTPENLCPYLLEKFSSLCAFHVQHWRLSALFPQKTGIQLERFLHWWISYRSAKSNTGLVLDQSCCYLASEHFGYVNGSWEQPALDARWAGRPERKERKGAGGHCLLHLVIEKVDDCSSRPAVCFNCNWK